MSILVHRCSDEYWSAIVLRCTLFDYSIAGAFSNEHQNKFDGAQSATLEETLLSPVFSLNFAVTSKWCVDQAQVFLRARPSMAVAHIRIFSLEQSLAVKLACYAKNLPFKDCGDDCCALFAEPESVTPSQPPKNSDVIWQAEN